MLRELRKADVPAYLRLLLENFPEEQKLVGYRPEPMIRIIRRLFRPDWRLILGFLRLIHRPVFRLFVVEEEGTIAAAALLTYGSESGYVSTVVTDPRFRRRGFGRRVVRACREATRAAGRRHVVLDVLSTNRPARALYESEGFAFLRHQALWAGPVPSSSAASAPGIRALAKRDLRPIAELATGALSAPAREVIPVSPSELAVSPLVTYGLASESEAWVLDEGAGAVGYLRATVGAATSSGHLSQPILAPSVGPERSADLVAVALEWLRVRGAPTVVSEVPAENVAGAAALHAAGLREAHGLDTLVQPATG